MNDKYRKFWQNLVLCLGDPAEKSARARVKKYKNMDFTYFQGTLIPTPRYGIHFSGAKVSKIITFLILFVTYSGRKRLKFTGPNESYDRSETRAGPADTYAQPPRQLCPSDA